MKLLKLSMIVALALTFKVLYAGATVIVDNYGLIGALTAIAGIYWLSVVLARRGW